MIVLYSPGWDVKICASFYLARSKTGSAIPCIGTARMMEPRGGIPFIGTYNDRTSPQTYQIRIVIRYIEVQYLVYYQFTI
jgi:hypothetical protein